MSKPTLVLSLLALGLLTGCPEPRPASPSPPPPAPVPRELAAVPREAQYPGPDPTETEEERSVPKLILELDTSDPRRIYHATIELLNSRDDRRSLEAIGERLRGSRSEQQRNILYAIGRYPDAARGTVSPDLVIELMPLIRPFLGHPEADLRKEAIDAFAALDALEPNDAVDPVGKEVESILTAPKDKGPTLNERISAVRVIARKPPRFAIPRLNAAFEGATIPDVREAVRKELQRVTGKSFRSASDAKRWWEQNQDKSQDQWYQEQIERVENERNTARNAARSWWRRYMLAIATDAPRYFAELKETLQNSDVPQIQTEAAKKLVETGDPTAYGVVLDLLANRDTDVEVRRSILLDALTAQKPPEPVRQQIISRILPLTDDPEKDIRAAAITALGELKAEEAEPRLLRRIANRSRDSDVAVAVLAALSKIGGAGDGPVGRALNDFLKQELERDAADPLRDVRLLEQAAGAIGGLQYGDSSPEADRAVGLLVKVLEWNDAADPRGSARVHQVAIISLGSLKRPAALKALIGALDDKDDQVAAEAARAIGAVAGGKFASEGDRKDGIAALQRAFDGAKTGLKDAALDAIVEVLKSDPSNVAKFREVADRLAKDPARIIRLLKDLPSKLGPEATPAARQTLLDLRRTLADAYENAVPPDPKAAVEIWKDLRKEDLERYGERYAQGLQLLGSVQNLLEADDVWVDLLRRRTAPADALKYWTQRLNLVRRLKAVDRATARDLLRRMKADPATLPPSLKKDLDDLDRELGAEATAPEPAGTVPATPGGSRIAPPFVPASGNPPDGAGRPAGGRPSEKTGP